MNTLVDDPLMALTLPVPSPEMCAKGAIGPRKSSIFRRPAVQRLGLERNATILTTFGFTQLPLSQRSIDRIAFTGLSFLGETYVRFSL
jgi:hypothetical protein